MLAFCSQALWALQCAFIAAWVCDIVFFSFIDVTAIKITLQVTKKAWRCWGISIPSAHNQSPIIAILLMFYS
jgi:hypothetical protein